MEVDDYSNKEEVEVEHETLKVKDELIQPEIESPRVVNLDPGFLLAPEPEIESSENSIDLFER